MVVIDKLPTDCKYSFQYQGKNIVQVEYVWQDGFVDDDPNTPTCFRWSEPAGYIKVVTRIDEPTAAQVNEAEAHKNFETKLRLDNNWKAIHPNCLIPTNEALSCPIVFIWNEVSRNYQNVDTGETIDPHWIVDDRYDLLAYSFSNGTDWGEYWCESENNVEWSDNAFLALGQGELEVACLIPDDAPWAWWLAEPYEGRSCSLKHSPSRLNSVRWRAINNCHCDRCSY